ncbi:MAG: nucleoside triphosphate pyrophosphohydrolase, partial [Eubacteriales bacterium]|nr:nucleoside triphosphate pyrophosphohydrolase [Eubacteriales bacterium]
VCDGICKKLIVRHPHIFSDVSANTSDEVLKNWEEIKKKTKSDSRKSAMDGIPPSLPSLMRASKACKKASDAGYVAESFDAAADKIITEAMKLRNIRDAEDKDSNNRDDFTRVMGRLLFAVAEASRIMDTDAEEALGREVDRFTEKIRSDEAATGRR